MDSSVIVRSTFVGATVVLALYAIRHYILAVARMFLAQPRDFSEIEGFDLPSLTVIVPMHNEEEVAADALEALASSDYDPALLQILAIDDRSHDATGRIIDDFASRFPFIQAVHRTSGNGGKPGALDMATPLATGEIIVIFDADYVPGTGILKMLASPFADPQTGAVMGRVVPVNAGASLMSGLLSLDRAAGYQVGQQARFNLGLVPQFGGTVGGVRKSALTAIGGWNVNSLTEDTDLTCRLVLKGWKIAYVNRAECYEQAPQSWEVRRRQLRRWVIGHNECMHHFALPVLRSGILSLKEKVDLLFMLGCYWTAPFLVIASAASMILFFRQQAVPADALIVALLLIGCQMFASQASFFELTAACFLDQEKERVLLLPLTLLNFAATTGAICTALFDYYTTTLLSSGEFDWHKTVRYRTNGNGNGNGRGNSSEGGGNERPR